MDLTTTLVWFVLALIALVFFDRWIHRYLQGICMLLLRDEEAGTVLYAMLLLPGVILHEGSHWLTAKLLAVRTARFSIWPKRQRNGMLRMGYVETEKVDPLREAVIGAAPVIFGTAAIILIGIWRLQVNLLGEAFATGQVAVVGNALGIVFGTPDAFIWIYLLFAISNSMLPSASDRRAWPKVVLGAFIIAGVTYFIGILDEIALAFTPAILLILQYLAIAFTITVALNLLVIPILHLIQSGLTRITGARIEYSE